MSTEPPAQSSDTGGESLNVGDRVQATVTGIARYGVFVTTPEGHRGLVHISEISDWFVEDARDYFRIGETVLVEVIDRQAETGKYAFSTRRLGGKQPLTGARSPCLLPVHRRAGGRTSPQPVSPAPDDQEAIVAFLARRVGNVSDDARRHLSRLMERYGAVPVALAVADANKRFDRALALLQWVERRLQED